MSTSDKLHLAFALSASGRAPGSAAGQPATAQEWEAILRTVDGHADFLTLEDHFGDWADGYDATLLANRLGPLAREIGIIPGAVLNYNEPFHVSTAIATLDYVTEGRAGLLAQQLTPEQAESVSRVQGELNGFPNPTEADLTEDALDSIEVIRSLWDSWEDDAVIRDVESQRFVDGAKLHYIAFKGKRFNVLGPSIVPRPPQGQPVVAASAGNDSQLAFAGAAADVVFLQPGETPVGEFLARAQAAAVKAGRAAPLRYFLDVPVSFDGEPEAGLPAAGWFGPASGLAGQLQDWRAAGIEGFRFIPRDSQRDIAGLTEVVIPALHAAGLLPEGRAHSLRERLNLPVAINRYTAAA